MSLYEGEHFVIDKACEHRNIPRHELQSIIRRNINSISATTLIKHCCSIIVIWIQPFTVTYKILTNLTVWLKPHNYTQIYFAVMAKKIKLLPFNSESMNLERSVCGWKITWEIQSNLLDWCFPLTNCKLADGQHFGACVCFVIHKTGLETSLLW